MDSRASTSTLTSSPKPKPLIIETSNRSQQMVSKTIALSPSSPFPTYRPSPLNPESIPSPGDKSNYPPKRSSAFPASRPLRPFPSVPQSIASTKPIVPGTGVHVRGDDGLPKRGGDAGTVAGVKRPPKTIEISSKWKGGFFVLGMTQAEFSRRD